MFTKKKISVKQQKKTHTSNIVCTLSSIQCGAHAVYRGKRKRERVKVILCAILNSTVNKI